MRYSGGLNVPGSAGNNVGLAMSIAANYSQPPYSYGTQQDIDMFKQRQMKPAGASFDPSELNVQPRIQPGDDGYNPFVLEQDRDRFILNNPRSGVAQMPRFIHGYSPRGMVKAPHIDSRYMDEKIRRGFAPMPPPVQNIGPQLPGFV